ncbi:DNA mismatch repair protein [Pseudoflavitalea sp. G-6-1-2]|uniref:MutS-related protein n=1 Tax=Pseudoflavitalea sp. G-6-1-2 TaxID=2728841 RepID=UPI00146A0C31|nr:DNA mismatch repair protein [Pseudoflavitalea sp. G-6-1-2]NML22567.1 DNA mismatch repair protein [Pseudoflavitalea sp. G-6-1-2]
MVFTTDKQTLEDLRIFSRQSDNSIYDNFNRCVTRGGAAVLEEMFRYPMSDHEAINRRIAIFQYFGASGIAFPFQSVLFDSAEPYLDNNDERTRLSAEKLSITQKFTDLVARENAITMLHKGIQALIEILQGLRKFIQTIPEKGSADYFSEKEAITKLLDEPDLAGILNASGKKPSPHEMAMYDELLRFRHRDTMQKCLRFVYQLDVYISIGIIAKEKGYAFPKALPRDQHTLTIEGLYHPQVEHAVPNNISITPEGNVIFLTGANMAGKSTFMKSLSIAIFLAHMGFPVPAKSMEFSVLDGIYTTINLPDNLGMGASHFYAEVLRVKKMASELSSNKNLFIVFDELFRGTNVKDAYEATIEITAAFAGKKNSLFVISTHIVEAADVLKQQCSNVRFIYLPTRMRGNQPEYTYQLEAGITNDRHGMIIIQNEGIIDILNAGIKKQPTV